MYIGPVARQHLLTGLFNIPNTNVKYLINIPGLTKSYTIYPVLFGDMTQVIIPSFQVLNQLHGLVCFVSSTSFSVAFFSHRSLTRICIDHLPCLLKLPTLSQRSQRVGKAVTPCGFPLDVIHRSTNRPSHIPTQPEVILFSICVQGEALPRRDGDLTMTKMGWNMMEPSNMALEATEMPHRNTWRTLFIHQPTIHRNEKLLGGISTYSRKNSLRVWGSLSKEV